MDNGGYRGGFLTNAIEEELQFGPGCLDDEVKPAPEPSQTRSRRTKRYCESFRGVLPESAEKDSTEELEGRGAQDASPPRPRLFGEHKEDDDEEEADERRVMRDPGQPSAKEMEEHRIDHWPYRSWCPFCVRGRATGKQHRSRSEECAVPTFGFDYLHANGLKGTHPDEDLPYERICECGFHLSPGERYCGDCGKEFPITSWRAEPSATRAGSATRGEEDYPPDAPDGVMAPTRILVAKCFSTKCFFAHVVPQKGVDVERYAVERLAKDVQWLGHSRVILRSDNEPAIQKLLTEITRDDQTGSTDQLVYDVAFLQGLSRAYNLAKVKIQA